MRKREITSSLFWLLIGLILTIWSATYPIGNLAQPGTGFLPLGLGILMIIFSATLLIRAFKSTSAEKGTALTFPKRWLSLSVTVLILLAAVFLFENVGYMIIFFVLALVLPVLAGDITWRRSLIFAIFSTAGVYIIFVWLLKQPLPTGFLGW
ncbi:MAG TPA: tripartite tricarboxylate transporter TctB family protein [Syntrophorhabdales bacterium]|nr:tripartite tricarboxylate transporter TctB family protein [Syntrophorhabdales bacterium]